MSYVANIHPVPNNAFVELTDSEAYDVNGGIFKALIKAVTFVVVGGAVAVGVALTVVAVVAVVSWIIN